MERPGRRLCTIIVATLGWIVLGSGHGEPFHPGILAGAGAQAQTPEDTGIVEGQVLEEETGEPLAGAGVSIAGTGISTITGGDGTFEFTEVPEGEATLEVEVIGFEEAAQEIQVAAGERVNVEIELRTEALGLDEVVVTGTPGGAERRAVGTSLSSLDAGELTRTAPVTTMEQVLQGREAGMVGMGASGTVGSSQSLNLRGVTSATQGNQPLIYVDGVRLETSQGMSGGGEATSRLAALNPQDIETVEVIKGAAATTLYGSEASAGVIQIFTHSGTEEETYSLSARVGASQIPPDLPLQHPDPQYPSANDILRTGLYHELDVSARGASGGINYYVSGSHSSEDGGVPGNHHDRSSARLNVGFSPHEDLDLDFRTNFMRSETGMMIQDNVITGVLANIMLGDPAALGSEDDPFGGAYMPYSRAVEQSRVEETFQFVGGTEVNHRIGTRFDQSLTLGIDFGDTERLLEWPYSEEHDWPRSERTSVRERNLRTNLDYSANLSLDLSADWTNRISVGGQLARRDATEQSAEGLDFPAPGLRIIDATAQRDVGESLLDYATGGFFVQNQVGYDDRIFLTAGLRADGSSVFGDDFGLQPYPKADVSWVISESPWFNVPQVESLRLRAAFGLAGQQPGAFDAQRTFEPFNHVGGQVGVRQATIGDPDLGPEVTQELEGGFEAALMGGRLDLDVTGYLQSTEDLLVQRSFPASEGFTASQLTNLGEARNVGLELTLDAALYQSADVLWDVTTTYSYNRSELTDLGDLDDINLDRFGTYLTPGYSIPSKWGVVKEGTDDDGMPIPSDEEQYQGPAMPPHNGNINTNVTWRGWGAFANAQWAAGHIVTNLRQPFMISSGTGEEYYRLVEEAGGDTDAPAVQALRAKADCCPGEFMESGDWLKLREIGVSYELPARLIGGQESGRSVQVFASGRNLLTLTGYSGVDPESAAQFGDDETGLRVSSEFMTLPQRRQFVTGVNVSF